MKIGWEYMDIIKAELYANKRKGKRPRSVEEGDNNRISKAKGKGST